MTPNCSLPSRNIFDSFGKHLLPFCISEQKQGSFCTHSLLSLATEILLIQISKLQIALSVFERKLHASATVPVLISEVRTEHGDFMGSSSQLSMTLWLLILHKASGHTCNMDLLTKTFSLHASNSGINCRNPPPKRGRHTTQSKEQRKSTR